MKKSIFSLLVFIPVFVVAIIIFRQKYINKQKQESNFIETGSKECTIAKNSSNDLLCRRAFLLEYPEYDNENYDIICGSDMFDNCYCSVLEKIKPDFSLKYIESIPDYKEIKTLNFKIKDVNIILQKDSTIKDNTICE